MKKALLALLLFLFSLFLLAVLTARSLVGTLFSEVHSPKWFGPGVDIFFTGVSPTPGGTIDVEVKVRGGSAAGIRVITATLDEEPPQKIAGGGVTWSGSVSSKSIGESSEFISLKIPESFTPGSHSLLLDVEYVLALSSNYSYSNEDYQERLRVVFSVGSAAKQLGERLLLLLQALLFLGFGGWSITWLTRRFKEKSVDEELLGYLIVEGLVASALAAYWLFSWPVQRALGLPHEFFSVVLVLGWFVMIIWLMIKHSREPKSPVMRYTLRLEVLQDSGDPDPYRATKNPTHVWVSLLELSKLFQKEKLKTRLWFWSLSVSFVIETVKIQIGSDNDIWVYSRSSLYAERVAEIIANQVGKVYFDGNSISRIIHGRPTSK